jgi:hypothetical protein
MRLLLEGGIPSQEIYLIIRKLLQQKRTEVKKQPSQIAIEPEQAFKAQLQH